MIARLLVMAGVVAMLATGAVAANAAETPVATAQHAVSVSAVQPATRCANWCELKNHKAPWQCLDADTAHRFWLGKVNVTVALARGQINAKGPVAKILKLVPLVKPVFPRYQQMLEEAKRDDLLKAA